MSKVLRHMSELKALTTAYGQFQQAEREGRPDTGWADFCDFLAGIDLGAVLSYVQNLERQVESAPKGGS